jgi:hypothetical protein
METRENKEIKPEFICDKCNIPMYTIEELGYLGNPHLTNFDCSPFSELMTLCKECTPSDFIKKR